MKFDRINCDILFSSEHRPKDVSKKSVRGGMATIGSQVIITLLGIVGLSVLARLLTPQDYGLISMVTVVVNFVQMFKNAGLSMATVQKDVITREQISTLFWINVMISFSLGICIFIASPLVSKFYGKPELTAITAWLALSFIISGFVIQHQALLRRHMYFGSIAVIHITSKIISLIVTIILALYGWRYWALVGGTLVSSLSLTILTFVFCPWLPGRVRKGTGVRDMLKFGGHLTGFNFINYFSRNADNILIGRFIGAEALGLYNKAYQLFMLPITQVRMPLSNVAMPVLSSLKEQPERYIKYYIRLVDILATLSIPIALYCLVEADFIISVVLGPLWMEVVPVFRVLAIAGIFQSVTTTTGLVQMSCGESYRYLKWGIISSCVYVSSFVIGLPYGIIGVAISYTIANVLIVVPSLYYCFYKTPIKVLHFVKAMTKPLFISSIAAIILFAASIILDDTLMNHIILLVLFSIVYCGLSSLRKTVRELISLFIKYGSSYDGKAPKALEF